MPTRLTGAESNRALPLALPASVRFTDLELQGFFAARLATVSLIARRTLLTTVPVSPASYRPNLSEASSSISMITGPDGADGK